MADIDPKVSQAAFNDYRRGIDVKDISQRHGLNTRQVNQVIKFESTVHSRVQSELAKVQKRQEKKPAVRQAKAGGKPDGKK